MSTPCQKKDHLGEGEDRIDLHRMNYKDAGELLKGLAALLVKLYRDGKLGDITLSADGLRIGGQAYDALAGLLLDLIRDSEELVLQLLTSSTGKTVSELLQLDYVIVLQLIEKALALNFDAEAKKSLAAVGAAVRALMPAQPKLNSSAASTST
jgi:hypothetical protein